VLPRGKKRIFHLGKDNIFGMILNRKGGGGFCFFKIFKDATWGI